MLTLDTKANTESDVVLIHSTKAKRGRRKYPVILNLDVRWRWVVNLIRQPFYAQVGRGGGKPAVTHWKGRWVVPGGSMEMFGRRDKFLPLPEFEHRIVYPVAKSLYRLSYTGSWRLREKIKFWFSLQHKHFSSLQFLGEYQTFIQNELWWENKKGDEYAWTWRGHLIGSRKSCFFFFMVVFPTS